MITARDAEHGIIGNRIPIATLDYGDHLSGLRRSSWIRQAPPVLI